MKMVLIGAPGSGKGTQTNLIVQQYNFVVIGTGDLLRSEIKTGTTLGQLAKPYIETGELVPLNIILDMIKNKINLLCEENKSFLMDGFPRDIYQASALDKILEKFGQTLDLVIFVETNDEEILKRMLSRARSDDQSDIIKNRLRVFNENTRQLINYYQDRAVLRHVNGVGEITEVNERIRLIIDSFLR